MPVRLDPEVEASLKITVAAQPNEDLPDMIKLYDFLPCPFGQKVRIVLAEKALTYDLVQVDLTQHENRKPDFVRLNPFGRVPVLVDDDTTIYDSTIINEYLEDEYPEPPLLPPVGASAMRARARRSRISPTPRSRRRSAS